MNRGYGRGYAIAGGVAVMLSVLSACGSEQTPSCDVLGVDTLEQYVGSDVLLDAAATTSKDGDDRICVYKVIASNGSSVSVMILPGSSRIDEYEPNSAAQPQTKCGQDELTVVTDCQSGTVGGDDDSWCEVYGGDVADHTGLSIAWMNGDRALSLRATIARGDDPFIGLSTCDDMEELAGLFDEQL